MKKKDVILGVIIIIVALVSFGLYEILGKEARYITVTIDGKKEGTYDLREDQTLELNNGTNILVIKKEEAFMQEADCPDQICVNHKPVKKDFETIVCLPNKIVVEVTSDQTSSIDTMTN